MISNLSATCTLCQQHFPDNKLIVMFPVYDDGKAASTVQHIECMDCHRSHVDHLNDNALDGPELCGTLREFRDGTLPLGWWKSGFYYQMRAIEVEDGQFAQEQYYG